MIFCDQTPNIQSTSHNELTSQTSELQGLIRKAVTGAASGPCTLYALSARNACLKWDDRVGRHLHGNKAGTVIVNFRKPHQTMTVTEVLTSTDHPDDSACKEADDEHDTLKYHLLGPSLTKAGQDAVDQKKVCQ